MKRWVFGLCAILLFAVRLCADTLTNGVCAAGTTSSSGCAVITSSGYGTVGVQITGTFSGTLAFEATNDDTTWVVVSAYKSTDPTTAVTTTTTTGVYAIPVAGLKRVRVRFSTYASGSAVVTSIRSDARLWSPGGGSGNPFDQSLNTTDSPTFNDLTVNTLAGLYNSYTAVAITFGLTTLTGGATTVQDAGTGIGNDAQTTAITLPFTFSFFGTDYTDVYIYSNGAISFDATQAQSLYSQDVAFPTTDQVVNVAMGAFGAYQLSTSGTIKYQAFGTTPNQTFVIEWRDCPVYDDNLLLDTHQIILHENNTIEFQAQAVHGVVGATYPWTQGVQNASGNLYVGHANRNNQSNPAFDLTNDGTRLTPVALSSGALLSTDDSGTLFVARLPLQLTKPPLIPSSLTSTAHVTASACGASPVVTGGFLFGGSVTAGGTVTNCVVTLPESWALYSPAGNATCVANAISAANAPKLVHAEAANTTLTFYGSFANGDVIRYVCFGHR